MQKHMHKTVNNSIAWSNINKTAYICLGIINTMWNIMRLTLLLVWMNELGPYIYIQFMCIYINKYEYIYMTKI